MRMKYEMEGQMSLFAQDGWFLKMSPEHYQAEAPRGKISESSLKKRHGSKTQTPLFLNLMTENGQTPDASWEMGGALLGEYLMHSFGESPKEGVESHLSQILVDDPPLESYLSGKACGGILRRSKERGKELPEILRMALENQASHLKFGGGAEFDRYGKRAGKGALIQTELSGTLGVSQDQTLITPMVLEHHPQDSRITISEDDVVQSLTGRRGTGGNNVPLCLESVTPTHTHTHTTVFAEKRFFEWHEDDRSVSIRAKSGSYGGGSECLIAEDRGKSSI